MKYFPIPDTTLLLPDCPGEGQVIGTESGEVWGGEIVILRAACQDRERRVKSVTTVTTPVEAFI